MNGNKILVIGAVIVLLIITALLLNMQGGIKPSPNDGNTQIPNPASVFCNDHNGTLEIRTYADGQMGICKFSNNTECEEWAYMRGVCFNGVYATTPNKACTLEYMPVCGIDGKTYGNKCAADNVPIAKTGECLTNCASECPQYRQASPDYCKGGTIIPPTADECGCYGPPSCSYSDSQSCLIDSDCIPLPSECHTHTCINKSFANNFTKVDFCTEMFDCGAAYTPSDCGCVAGMCVNKKIGGDCGASVVQ